MTKIAAAALVFVAGVHLCAQGSLAGEWVIAQDVYGYSNQRKLVLKIDGRSVTGTIGTVGSLPITGTADGSRITFQFKTDNATEAFTGTLAGDELGGTFVHTDSDGSAPRTGRWTARRIPTRPAGPPRRHEFTPTTFARVFSPTLAPVLTIWPGDTVSTTTVDAGGTDGQGVTRSLGGNPQTGPFYVETAMPGDTLAVHFTRIRLNRDWAISDDGLVDRALDADLAVKMKDNGKNIRWRLDRQRGVASVMNATDRLSTYTIPLRPMLGCVAVAPGFGSAAPPTGDSGRFGGNMDFNEIIEGTTVFLRVSQPGALLYVGDGHAAQGDGELNGNALETSMDVEFTVDVKRGPPISTPRVESPTHLMTVGLAGSLDAALQTATAGLSQWLEQEYKLNPSELALVLGSSIEYTVAEVADRNAAIAAKIRKDRLVFKRD